MNPFIKKVLALGLAVILAFGPEASYAQSLFLPEPGAMVQASPAFVPVIMKGLTVHPDNPLLFDFIVDTGNSNLKQGADDAALKAESGRLVKYFLASLAIPEKDQWVNLSPYEKDRILPEELGRTELGRDMLAQDYLLKQVTSSMIHPDKALGKEFWARIYARAQKEFGTTDIPLDTFNKVWITADKADVFVKNNTAFIVGSHLKVQLEKDYLVTSVILRPLAVGMTQSDDLTKQLMRSIILPELEKEVNTGKNFASLRQIFHSMVLATWYKKNLKNALLTQIYADRKKTNGVEGLWMKDKAADIDPQQVWLKYEQAYKTGVFNFIKEDIDPATGESVPHKYFSGGVVDLAQAKVVSGFDPAQALTAGSAMSVHVVMERTEEPLPAEETARLEKDLTGVIDQILDSGIPEALPADFLNIKRLPREWVPVLAEKYARARFPAPSTGFTDEQRARVSEILSVQAYQGREYASIRHFLSLIIGVLADVSFAPVLLVRQRSSQRDGDLNNFVRGSHVDALIAMDRQHPDALIARGESPEQRRLHNEIVFEFRRSEFNDHVGIMKRGFLKKSGTITAPEAPAADMPPLVPDGGVPTENVTPGALVDLWEWNRANILLKLEGDWRKARGRQILLIPGLVTAEVNSGRSGEFVTISLQPTRALGAREDGSGGQNVIFRYYKSESDRRVGKETAVMWDGSEDPRTRSFNVPLEEFDQMDVSLGDAAMAASLEDDVKFAWEARTLAGFLGFIHNDYLVDSQKRLEELGRHLIETDPYFARNIINPESLVSEWTTGTLEDKGVQRRVDVFNVRVANSSARGVPKGGIRALLNYLKKDPDAGEPRIASDLMRDPAFEKAFARLNALKPIEKQVRAFIQKWVEEEAKALSLWMSFKTSVLGVPLGGGKGVFFVGQIRQNSDGTFSIEDTELWNDKNRKSLAAVARSYARVLYAAQKVGHDIDVPAPDKRTDGVGMGFLTDEYILLNMKAGVIEKRDPVLSQWLQAVLREVEQRNGGIYPETGTALVEEAARYLLEMRKPVPELAVFTGKRIPGKDVTGRVIPGHGGVEGRTSATGDGVQAMIRSLLKAKGMNIQGSTLGVQGAGNVALYTALQAVKDGMIVRILGDEGVTLIKKDGFPEGEILEFLRRFEANKEKMYVIWKQVVDPQGVVAVEGSREELAKAVLEADVDVLSPCATEGVITVNNADNIRAKFVVPGANGPITPAALEALRARGIIVVPDTLANARGVLVSFFEQVQALTGYIFTAEEVAIISGRIHEAAFANVWAESQKRRVSLTEAADIVSAQGIIRAQYLTLIKKFNGDLKKISEARGHGESEAVLREQINASGLSAYLSAIANNSLSIRVVPAEDQQTLKDAIVSSEVIIAGTTVGEEKSPFVISKELLAGLNGKGRIFIDPMIDQGSIFPQEISALPATPLRPARLDGHGNLWFTVRNMPSVFGRVASKLLTQATQKLTREIAEGTVPKDESGVRSGIVVANGREVSPAAPVTDDEFQRIFLTPDGRKRTIGIPKEWLPGETRVGSTLEEIKAFIALGFKVFVEQGAGIASEIPDIDFQRAGVTVVSRSELWRMADVIRKVKAPVEEEYQYFRPGQIIEAFLFLDRPDSQGLKERLKASGVTAIAYEEVRKPGYRPLLDRVFFMEEVGAPEDEGRYILDPMSRVGGTVAALWAQLYYRPDGDYQQLVGADGVVEPTVVEERNFHLKGFIADIRVHLQEFVTHAYGFPSDLLKKSGLEKGVDKVLVIGGNRVARKAIYTSLLFGARNVEVLVVNEKEKALLEKQFRKDGLLRSAPDKAEAVLEEPSAAFEPAVPSVQRKAVLVVEDVAIQRDLMRMQIERFYKKRGVPVEVILANDDEQAMDILRDPEQRARVGALITDTDMPEALRGPRLIAAIRQEFSGDPFLEEARFFALSGEMGGVNEEKQMAYREAAGIEAPQDGFVPEAGARGLRSLTMMNKLSSKGFDDQFRAGNIILVDPAQAPVGGIDLDASKMALTEGGTTVGMNFDPAMVEDFKQGNFSGITPVILNITPIPSVISLLANK